MWIYFDLSCCLSAKPMSKNKQCTIPTKEDQRLDHTSWKSLYHVRSDPIDTEMTRGAPVPDCQLWTDWERTLPSPRLRYHGSRLRSSCSNVSRINRADLHCRSIAEQILQYARDGLLVGFSLIIMKNKNWRSSSIKNWRRSSWKRTPSPSYVFWVCGCVFILHSLVLVSITDY